MISSIWHWEECRPWSGKAIVFGYYPACACTARGVVIGHVFPSVPPKCGIKASAKYFQCIRKGENVFFTHKILITSTVLLSTASTSHTNLNCTHSHHMFIHINPLYHVQGTCQVKPETQKRALSLTATKILRGGGGMYSGDL